MLLFLWLQDDRVVRDHPLYHIHISSDLILWGLVSLLVLLLLLLYSLKYKPLLRLQLMLHSGVIANIT